MAINNQLLAINSTAYGYDAASRLATVADGNGNTATYSYVANSPLVGQIAFANNGTVRMTTTKQYDYLNRLTQISSAPSGSGAPPLAFNYNYNTANQRTAVTNANNAYWQYQYDNLGQVISGKKYWADGTPVAGQQFTYNFDDIGNRQSTGRGGDALGANLRTANYTANNLNQYTSREVPGYVDVLGSANPNATVTVNLQRAIRQGSYFSDELSVDNTGGPLYLSLTNLAVLNNGTNADIVVTNVGHQFVPQTPEFFGYDPDGNMTNSGRWTIIWDAENRAMSFTTVASAPLAAQRKVDCMYDWQGRRTQKIVSTNNGSAWIPISTNKFVYDGWNLIAILDGQSSVVQSFTWGTDLSGSIEGAGGVGGLLAMTVSSGTNAGTYFYGYDGNGNVSALVNSNNGTLAAQYEYGPFGEVIRANGPLAKSNPFRLSTKYQDDESGLLYYGYRYYNPSTGRWSSRDQIEEEGGVNLYGFTGNNAINSFDIFGLAIECNCKDTAKYLDGNGLTGMYDTAGNTFSAKKGAAGPSNGDGLILWRMLQTSHHFKVAKLDVKNLKENVAARRQIVQSALACNVTYGVPSVGGGWNPAWTLSFYKDPLAFFATINKPSTVIACQRISEVIFQTGNRFSVIGHRKYDGVWIPGDWGYINNEAYTDDGDWDVGGPNHDQNLGLQGENLICTGDDLFWGLFGPITPPRSKDTWFDDVTKWVPSHSGKHAIPAWRNRIDYTTIGLEQ